MASGTNLFSLEQIDDKKILDTSLIFEEINRELEKYLFEKSQDADSTDGVFDFLEGLSNCIQDEFDELIGEDTDKKRFIKALTHIFALLLNTKVDTADKIKKILKTAVETTLEMWQEQSSSTKTTVLLDDTYETNITSSKKNLPL